MLYSPLYRFSRPFIPINQRLLKTRTWNSGIVIVILFTFYICDKQCYFIITTKPPRGCSTNFLGNDLTDFFDTRHGFALLPLSSNSVAVVLSLPMNDQSTVMVCMLSLPLMPAMYHVLPLRRAITTLSPGYPDNKRVSSHTVGRSPINCCTARGCAR